MIWKDKKYKELIISNSLEEDEEELVLILEPDEPAKTKIKGEKSSKKKSSKHPCKENDEQCTFPRKEIGRTVQRKESEQEGYEKCKAYFFQS